MIYIAIDESGDFGEINEKGASKDFSMAACICYSEDIEYLSETIEKLVKRIKKKEIKFSKLSKKEVLIVRTIISKLKLEYFTYYFKKTKSMYGEKLLRKTFQELIANINIGSDKKIKVFIDGSENAYFRKIYEPIIKKKFPRAIVKFANSMKTPMIQIADFYAGQARRQGYALDK